MYAPLPGCADASLIYAQAGHLLAAGETVALATVIARRGSVPQAIGAKMLVRTDGGLTGTVGGGCGEAAVRRTALDVVDVGAPCRMQVDLMDDPVLDAEAVCGGLMDVFVDCWTPVDADLAERVGQGHEPVALALAVRQGSLPPRRLLVTSTSAVGNWLDSDRRSAVVAAARTALAAGNSSLVTVAGESVFIDVMMPSPRLIIAGAGHIAQPLAAMAGMAGYHVTVIDDRPDYAHRDRFPWADAVVCTNFARALDPKDLNPNTALVIVTRGHRHDFLLLGQALGHPLGYLGMIGSRRRVATVTNLLRERGAREEHLARVHAPIGFDIGAVTPAEIAVSIMAQLVQVRRGAAAVAPGQLPGRYKGDGIPVPRAASAR